MIELDHQQQIAIIKLNHPPANAIDAALLATLDESVKQQTDNDSKAIILTGQGSIFSAGVDLVQLLKGGQDYTSEFLTALENLLETLFFCPKPIVAAINGHAIAGGCVVACCADIRLMAQGKARIGVPELRVGVPFPVIIMELMRAKVQAAFFEEIMLCGQTYIPDEAMQKGLVDDVVNADELMDTALKQAVSLASIRPQIYAFTKLQIRQTVRERIEKNNALYADQIRTTWLSDQTSDAIRQYMEKTFKK